MRPGRRRRHPHHELVDDHLRAWLIDHVENTQNYTKAASPRPRRPRAGIRSAGGQVRCDYRAEFVARTSRKLASPGIHLGRVEPICQLCWCCEWDVEITSVERVRSRTRYLRRIGAKRTKFASRRKLKYLTTGDYDIPQGNSFNAT
jgi:hypothetical protein